MGGPYIQLQIEANSASESIHRQGQNYMDTNPEEEQVFL